MKIRITAPPFCDHSNIDKKGNMELREGVTLRDLYDKLNVAAILRPVLITWINFERAKAGAPLSDGDEVNIFWPISGG